MRATFVAVWVAVIPVACGGDATAPANPAVTAVAVAGTSAQLNIGMVASTVATIQPAIKVTDKNGNGVANVKVTSQITGGGTLQHPAPTTNASGVASVGAWSLGPTIGTQTVTLTVAGLPGVVFAVATTGTYAVDIRYVGVPPSETVQAAFAAAALRVSQVVTTKLSALSVTGVNAADYCQDPSLPTLDGTIQNVVIYVEVAPIDGVGQILGRSGPCGLRASNSLPFLGVMQFDSADFGVMAADGTLGAVVLHEMQHVLGFGTLWDGPPDFPTALLAGKNTANPLYLGASSRTQYVAAGGTAPSGVPVEGGTLIGTSNSHWRQTTFHNELMTGFLTGTTHPFSRVSIAALEDLGYTITYATAETFLVPAPGALRSGPLDNVSDAREQLIAPSFTIDERTGRTHRIR